MDGRVVVYVLHYETKNQAAKNSLGDSNRVVLFWRSTEMFLGGLSFSSGNKL